MINYFKFNIIKYLKNFYTIINNIAFQFLSFLQNLAFVSCFIKNNKSVKAIYRLEKGLQEIINDYRKYEKTLKILDENLIESLNDSSINLNEEHLSLITEFNKTSIESISYLIILLKFIRKLIKEITHDQECEAYYNLKSIFTKNFQIECGQNNIKIKLFKKPFMEMLKLIIKYYKNCCNEDCLNINIKKSDTLTLAFGINSKFINNLDEAIIESNILLLYKIKLLGTINNFKIRTHDSEEHGLLTLTQMSV